LPRRERRQVPTGFAERVFRSTARPDDLAVNHADRAPRECIGAAPKEFGSKMAKAVTEIRSLARSHTRTAINVLVGIMRAKDATAAARVTAANAILDRGWGKAPLAMQNSGDGVQELIERIERIIVHPENSDSYRLYQPLSPWSYPNALYWRKSIK
jgi:hypothetical protein